MKSILDEQPPKSRNKKQPRRTARTRAEDLTEREFMRQLVRALDAMRDGDFSLRLPSDWSNLQGKVADSLNAISVRMERFNTSLVRLRRNVGEEGKIGERLAIGDAVGSWA